jgi:hypothetical protein
MKNIKLTAVIVSLIMLVLAFTSCQTPPEDLELPKEDCVMVYTISENEYIRILLSSNSQFSFYGEWVKGDKTEAVYLEHYVRPSTFAGGDGGLVCDIEIFDPTEKDQVHSSTCNHTYSFEKGAMNSSYLINPKTEEKIPITFSIDKNVNFYFSWVSQIYLDFFNTDNNIYKEESQNFWYDFEAQKGEWIVNDKVVPIRMEFKGITPQKITLYIYDVSEDVNTNRYILTASGEITDKNTFISTEISGTMFYEGSVQELTIVRTPKS